MPRSIEERIHPERSPDRRTVDLHLARYRWAASRCAARLAPGPRVLDLACGTGYGAAILYEGGAREVVGADRDGPTIARAQAEHGRDGIRFETVSDAASYRPDAPFDLVVSLETVEHLPSPIGFLRAAHGWLRPGGMLVASVPLDEAPGKNPHHLHQLTRRSFEAIVGEGFSIEEALDQGKEYLTVAARRLERPAAAWGNRAAQPALRVVLHVRDRLDRTIGLVSAIRRGTEAPHRLEILDEGSTDGTASFLRILAADSVGLATGVLPAVHLCGAHTAVLDDAWLSAIGARISAAPGRIALPRGAEARWGARKGSAGSPRDLLCANGGLVAFHPGDGPAPPLEGLLSRAPDRPPLVLEEAASSPWGSAEPPPGAQVIHPARDAGR